MKKSLLLLLFPLLIHFSASAQKAQAASGKSPFTDEMLEILLKADQKRFNLTSEQMVQDKRVLLNYRAKSDAIIQHPPTSVEQLKAAVKKASLETAQGYKTFLTPEQYKKYRTTFNKQHPNAQID